MNFIKILARVINIILLSVLFLIATGYALSPSSEEIFGIKYFNITNILYYIGYIFFGIALLQYIRKKSVGWHNFYLAFMLVIFSWFFLLIIIFHPLFDEALESNNNIYVEIIELYFDFENNIKNSETVPLYFYEYLLDIGFSYKNLIAFK